MSRNATSANPVSKFSGGAYPGPPNFFSPPRGSKMFFRGSTSLEPLGAPSHNIFSKLILDFDY